MFFLWKILFYIYNHMSLPEHQLKKKATPLVEALLFCEDTTSLYAFLRDLLTPAEIEEFSQRRDIASRLTEWQSYKQIEQETHISSTTIARVSKFLHGDFEGYKYVLDLQKQTNKSKI